jgi:putative membrane protein
MTEPAPAPGETSRDDAEPWRRLDKRMLVVGPLGSLVRLVPVAVIVVWTGQDETTTRLWIPLGLAVLVVVAGVVRWRTTRYRITGDRVELHSGWLRRQRRSVPRDRIRSVDLTARLLHRAFGLSVVQVAAASGAPLENSGLSLDAVSKAEAERLRRQLLSGEPVADHPAAVPTGEPVAAPVSAPPPAEVLARLQWSWLRFAPLTFSSIAGVGAVLATVFNLVDDLGLDPGEIGVVADTADRLATAPFWQTLAVVSVGLLMTAIVGALLLFAERWYDYRLTREGRDAAPGHGPERAAIGTGTLRVKRGLLTRRSLSVSEGRLRGAEIVEPLLLRAGRGAQCRALSTGLSRDAQGGALQPPAPRAEAQRVASAALREHPAQIIGAPLRSHPRAALVRRMSRALLPVAVLVAAAFLLGGLVPAVAWLGPASLVLLPIGVLLGADRYRNLGHQVTSRYLVSRQGSVQRRTVALHRTGVIGWTFRQSIFQRRSGLVVVEAVTAAGMGGYAVLDVAAPDGVALADATTPHLLTPFRLPPTAPGADVAE